MATLKADNTYLGLFPTTLDPSPTTLDPSPTTGLPGIPNPAPVLAWDWWDTGSSALTCYPDVPGIWQSFETQNGGG